VVKSWKERLFVLAIDKLAYYEPSALDENAVLKGVAPLGVIRLSDVTSAAATRSRCTFRIAVSANASSGAAPREYLLVAASDKEREEWLTALRRAIFSPSRAVEILHTAGELQRDGLLCARELAQVKAWLTAGSDADLARAAACTSDAALRDPATRASDACESCLVDFKTVMDEKGLLRVLAELRRVLRDEEDGVPSTQGTPANAAAAYVGVPTEAYRMALLETAIEHIANTATMGAAAAAAASSPPAPLSRSTSGTSVGASATAPTQSARHLAPSPSASWLTLPSFGSIRRGLSTDGVGRGIDRGSSTASSTISGTTSEFGSNSEASVRVSPIESNAPPGLWTPDVREAFGLVLHQVAVRVAMAEARATRARGESSQRTSRATSAAGLPTHGEGKLELTLATVHESTAAPLVVSLPEQQLAAATEAPPVRPAVDGGIEGPTGTSQQAVAAEAPAQPAAEDGGAGPAAEIAAEQAAAVSPDAPAAVEAAVFAPNAAAPAAAEAGENPSTTPEPPQESLDAIFERTGLADDLRRLQKARAAGTPQRHRTSGARSRGESSAMGTPRHRSSVEEGGIESILDGIEEAADEGAGRVAEREERLSDTAMFRGPTTRARAATFASVQLSASKVRGSARRAAAVAARAPVLPVAEPRHSAKVTAVAAEAAVMGSETQLLHVDPNDPDPCSVLRDDAPFASAYLLGDRIGEGAYSVVYRGTHLASGEAVAVKIARKAAMTPVEQRRLLEEVRIMSVLDHDHIVRLQAFHEDADAYYICSELCTGGELFDKIVTRSTYSEREAREVVRTIAEAVAYMHAHGVVHRDLKPENILLSSPDDETAIIKIADMGFAKVVPFGAGCTMRTSCGTPSYVAPEILEGRPYDASVDLWSLGVVAYILLAGYAPFHARNQTELFRSIVAGRYHFDSPYWDDVSEGAKDLIRKLLVVDPSRRLNAAAVLQHRWLRGTVSAVELTSAVHQLRILQHSRRAILRQGELTKRGAIFWSWRRRTFVVTSETLEYFECAEFADGNNALARPKGVLSLKDIESVVCLDGAEATALQAPTIVTALTGATVSTAAADPGAIPAAVLCLFSLRVAGGRTYYLGADSEADRAEWVRAIASARAASDLLRKALLAKEAHADTDLVSLMKLAAAWKDLVEAEAAVG